MKLRPEEITSVLKSRIQRYEPGVEIQEVGTVVQVGDGVARIQGLENAVASEMLELPHNVMGLVLNLEEDSIGAVLMGEDTLIKEGDQVKRTGKVIQVPVGEALIGRVVNPLGVPLDDKGPIETTQFRPVEFKAPGVIRRQPVTEPLQTGVKAIDSMIPSAAASASSSSATAAPARRPSPWTPSSTRRARTSSASTWPSARRPPRWPASYSASSNTAPWTTPSS